MLKTLLFLGLISLEPVFIHLNTFPEVQPFDFSCFFVFFQAFLLLGFLLTFNKKIVAAGFVAEALFFILLLTWHKYYSDPISLSVIFHQYKEGLTFAQKSGSSFMILPNFFVLLFLALKLIYLSLFDIKMPYPKTSRIAFLLPFLLMAGFIYRYSRVNLFSISNLREYAVNMGYVQAWVYEMASDANTKVWEERIIADSNSPANPLPEELKGLTLPENIFLIQVESLDYAAILAEENGKKVMPYLQALSEKSGFYRIPPHAKKGSANTDFCLLTGGTYYEETSVILYEFIPKSIAREIKTLPNIMKEKGYHTSIYHGFGGDFYNREEFSEVFGFDEIWFRDNLPIQAPKGVWGYDDLDLFKFALQNNKHAMNFNFIITVSSHEGFDIALKHNKIFSKPKNSMERYINAMNYVDMSLKELMETAPENSLFILLSDHASSRLPDESTALMIYDKRTPIPFQKSITPIQSFEIIKSILN